MGHTITAPDTVYVAAYIDLNKYVREDLEAVHHRTCDTQNVFNRIWTQILGEADEDTYRHLKSLTFAEVLTYVNKRIEGMPSEASCKKVPEYYVEMSSRQWRVYGWSVRSGCDMTMEDGTFRVHIRFKPATETCPNVYIEVGSKPLWMADWKTTLGKLLSTLDGMGIAQRPEVVSRLDIAHHTQAVQAHQFSHDNFVCRARDGAEITPHAAKAALAIAVTQGSVQELLNEWDTRFPDQYDWYKNGNPQMISFGKRGTSSIYARIYNKSAQIAHKPEDAAFFRALWINNKFDMAKGVTNIEFELVRECMRNRQFTVNNESFCINTVHDVITHFDDLRAYLIGNNETEGWLRMIQPNTATRRERAAIDPNWQLIRESIAALGEISQRRKAGMRMDIKQKELQTRVAKYAARLLQMTGQYIDPCSEYSDDAYIEIISEALADYSRQCRRTGDLSLSELVAISAAGRGN